MTKIAQKQVQKLKGTATTSNTAATSTSSKSTATETATEEKGKSKKGSLEYKRVDQIWDRSIYDYKLVDSAEKKKDDSDSVSDPLSASNCRLFAIYHLPLHALFANIFRAGLYCAPLLQLQERIHDDSH
jgi:hypothetical protein